MIRLFEAFAGYGGASFALRKANIPFTLVGYSEIDRYAIKCFEQNHSGRNYGDITKINWKEIPNFDLLTGGFPCQDVSLAGKGDLSKGRTALGMELIIALKERQPKYFLFENIKTIKNKEAKDFFIAFEKELVNSNYNFKKLILKSSDYGSPQQRERVWWVGKRKDLEGNIIDLLPRSNKFVIADILNQNYSGKRIFKVINPLKGKSNFGWHYEQGVYNVQGLTRALKASSGSGNIPKIILQDGSIRKLSGKECFRLMGFYNAEINLEGISETRQRQLAGNGWEITVPSLIFKSLFNKEEGGKEDD